MRTANMHEAKSQLSKLIEAALAGENVVIARHGVPAVRLVPVEPHTLDRAGGWLAGKARVLDPDWDKPDPELETSFYDGPTGREGRPGPR